MTNCDWLGFIDAGGYRDPLLWLSDGWTWVQAEAIEAPLYWLQRRRGLVALRARRAAAARSRRAGLPHLLLRGGRLSPAGPAPGCRPRPNGRRRRRISIRWRATSSTTPGPARPRAAGGGGLRQMFGDVWEWTGSAFLPYPGFRPAEGAVGEYNGKFMCRADGAAGRLLRHARAAMSGPATATSSIPISAGCSPACRLAKDL